MNIRTRVILLPAMALILGATFFSECNAANAAIKVGCGWSVNTDETKAVNEALVMLRRSVTNPNFVFVLNESAYDDNVVIKALNNSLKNTKVFGYEVSFAVFTQEGIHRGEKGSLALMGIEAKEWAFGIGGIDMSAVVSVDDIQKTATRAIETAIQNAGKKRGDVPSVVLIAPTRLKEEPILDAIQAMFGKEVKVMGGTPGSPMVFANNQVIDNGFALAVLYGNTKVGVGYHSGVQTGIRMDKELSGVVTAMGENSRIIKEIDGRPAFDVYNEWSEGRFDYIDIKNLKEPFEIWKTAGRNPLVKKYDLGDGKFGTNVAIPVKILPDRSIILGTDHKVGETLFYAVGIKNAYVKRAGTIVKHALVNGKIKKKNLIGGIHAYCRGAAFGQLGQEVSKLEPLVDETKKEMNGMPFIGGFTAGEQGNIPGHGCFHGNLSSSMVVFSKE